MSQGATKSFYSILNPRFAVFLFAAAVGVGFSWINHLPQHSRMVWLKRLNADPLPCKYSDLKIVLAGIECDRLGMNVWVTCPCGAEALGRKNVPFSYPKAVLWLGRLLPVRLSVADGDWLGPVIIVAFLLALSLAFQGTGFWMSAYFCALITSPPVLLGIERANYDLAIFCLIFLNISFLDRWSNAASYAVTFGLGMLKLYPIAAVLALIRKTKTSRILFSLTVAMEAIFILLSLDNLRDVARTTPQVAWGSFGYPVIFLLVSERFNALTWPTNIMLPMYVAVLVTLAYFARRTRQYWLGILNGGDMTYRSLFIAGGAIYSLCFAIGANFNYRSIFLLFTVPYLFSMRGVEGPQRRASGLILVTLLCAFWLTAIESRTLIRFLQAAMTWLLFIFFAPVCLTTSFDSLLEVRGRALHAIGRRKSDACQPSGGGAKE